MDAQTMISFGERLKTLREDADMTMRDLGEKVGLSEATLSRYESGKMEAKQTTIKVFSDIFGVSPAWLIGYDGAQKYAEPETRVAKRIPVLGCIAARKPAVACENIEWYEHVLEDDKVDFCLKVKGDSMIGARIFDGDIVFVRNQSEIENGEIAVIMIDDEATLKRVYQINGSVILRPENPMYQDMVFSKKDMKNVQVLGKVIYFKSEVR